MKRSLPKAPGLGTLVTIAIAAVLAAGCLVAYGDTGSPATDNGPAVVTTDGGTVAVGNNVGVQTADVTQNAVAVALAIANVSVVGAHCESNCPTVVITFNNASAVALNVSEVNQFLNQVCISCITHVQVLETPKAVATETSPAAPPRQGYCSPAGQYYDLERGQPDTDPQYAGMGLRPAQTDPVTHASSCGTPPAGDAATRDFPTLTVTGPASWSGTTVQFCIVAGPTGKPACQLIVVN